MPVLLGLLVVFGGQVLKTHLGITVDYNVHYVARMYVSSI